MQLSDHPPASPPANGMACQPEGALVRPNAFVSDHTKIMRLLAESEAEVRDNPAAAERVLLGTGLYERDEADGKLKIISDDRFCVPSRAS